MKVEIWSDIMCPFCYIGKRKFENALKEFENKNDIEIQWRSFQLAPDLKTDTSKNVYEYLAERKGWSLDVTRNIHAQMTETAKEVGLDYKFDKAIPANSFNAHRLSHLAAKYGLQDAVEERLFSAYFTEGKNIDDIETLVHLGADSGLSEDEIRNMLQSDLHADDVQKDIYEARQVGVRGVPHFVINDMYSISGAQPSELFLGALQKAWETFEKENADPSLNNTEGAACSTDGNC